MVGYYDFILAAIPATLLGISLLLHGAGLELTTAIPIGATASAATIGHGLFVRAPVTRNRP